MSLMKSWNNGMKDIFSFGMAFLMLKLTEVKDSITAKLTEHLLVESKYFMFVWK